MSRHFGLAAALAFVLSGCSGADRYRPLLVGDAVPVFEVATLDGESTTIGGSSSSPVLVNVWATWCIPCREEMPALQRLHERYDESLRIIGVNIDPGSDAPVRTFLENFGVTYENVRDPQDRVTASFRLVGVPETLLIDRDGRLVHRWIGRFDPQSEQAIAIIEDAIGAQPATLRLPSAPAFDLAITIDDLPWTAAQSAPVATVEAGTTRILEALRANGVTATGFIVCDAMSARPGNVERWAVAGHDLGNHTQRHPDLNTTPVAEWIRGVRECDDAIRAAGVRPGYFRYPMLHRGDDSDLRAAAARAIRELDYTVAPVTIDNSEWILAAAYEEAAASADSAVMRRIGILYIEHIRRATEHARAVARERLGREARQILLLHANRLNADWLDRLLPALRGDGARFVPLADALADAVYALADGYIGARGLSWLYRFEPARPDLADWDEAEEARVQAAVRDGG